MGLGGAAVQAHQHGPRYAARLRRADGFRFDIVL
jgi:hypothetical protein